MSQSKASNIFVSGPPGVGKSTLIEAVLSRLQVPATGFFTREIRDHRGRLGFAIVTLDGRRGVLAHREFKGRPRVGRYGVNLRDLEEIAVTAIAPRDPSAVVVVDEVGAMECLSSRFRQALLRALASPNLVIGSIALKGNDFIEEVKKRADVEVFYLTRANREQAVEGFSHLVRDRLVLLGRAHPERYLER